MNEPTTQAGVDLWLHQPLTSGSIRLRESIRAIETEARADQAAQIAKLESERATLVEAADKALTMSTGECDVCGAPPEDLHSDDCLYAPLNDLSDVLADLASAAKAHDAEQRAIGAREERARLREAAPNIPGVGIASPKDDKGRPLLFGHEEGCAYAFGNATYPCFCLVARSTVLTFLSEPSGDTPKETK
jgi:hypothetical protein